MKRKLISVILAFILTFALTFVAIYLFSKSKTKKVKFPKAMFSSNYKSKVIKSPSGKFSINTTVNRTNEIADDYAYVIIHLYDKNNKKIAQVNSRASDASKWAIGWAKSEDTIVMQSSDIGNQAWIIVNNKIAGIRITDELDKRAEYLKAIKYK